MPVQRLSRALCALALLCCLLLCASAEEQSDFAASLRLDMTSSTRKAIVTVKTFIDGDTTHFYTDAAPSGVLKARYLGINTPEITGKVEEYGQKAAAYTREKLESASSILIESDDESWNMDSTGERILAFVWYQPTPGAPYRCLNVELAQQGFARANSAGRNRYGTVMTEAFAQARALKLNLYSGLKDPDFYYGDAIELTLRALRCGLDAYAGKKVAFEGAITCNDGGSVYVEAYDADSGLYFGMPVYYGYSLNGMGLDILSVGNRARIVGTLQYYEAGGSYQVSGLSYRMMRPDDPGNIKKLGEGFAPAYAETSADTLSNGTVTLECDGEMRTLPYAEAALGTTARVRNLTVASVRTGDDGAVTLDCVSNGTPLKVRMPESCARGVSVSVGDTLDVCGIIDSHLGVCQLLALSPSGLVINTK